MPARSIRTFIRLAAAPLLLALVPVTARAGLLPCDVPTVNDRCESWSAVYNDPSIAQGSDQLEPRIATAPDGSREYVAVIDEALNAADPANSPASWQVLAYDGHTGAQLWSSTYQSDGHYDRPNAITVSPDGRFVYATGGSYDAPVLVAHDRDLVTIAYDAATGQQLWRTRNVDTSVHDVGTDILTSRDGSQVYATVDIATGNGEIDWAAIAYRASDGSVLWRTEYVGVQPGLSNAPAGMALSPSGDLLYITGESGTTVQYDLDYVTIAYATGGATPGAQAWLGRYDGVGQHWPDRPSGIAVDPGGRVLVTGDSISNFTTSVADDYATVAYDGASGKQLWASRYTGPAGGVNFGMAVAASPLGHVAVVTGEAEANGKSGDTVWATLGYDTVSGQQLWEQTLNTPGYLNQFPVAVGITPDGSTAVVTGFAGAKGGTAFTPPVAGGEAVTMAYAPATGTQQWAARYTAAVFDEDTPRALAIADDGSIFTAVQVAHQSSSPTDTSNNHYDVATLAYLSNTTPPAQVPEGQPWWLALVGMGLATGAVKLSRRRAATA